MKRLSPHNIEILAGSYVGSVVGELSSITPEGMVFLTRRDSDDSVCLYLENLGRVINAPTYRAMLEEFLRLTGRKQLPYAPMMARLLKENLPNATEA